MTSPNSNSSSVSGGIRLTTTLIACAWGLASAYTLFFSLLVKPNMRYFLIALFPLVAVWATIERKRWGRLALLGLSSAALGFFAANIGRVISVNYPAYQKGTLNVEDVVETLLKPFNYQPQIAMAVLVLAAMTAFWMCRPNVRAEYERGKNATLAVAQRAIAMTVVGCWGITFLLPTGTLAANDKKPVNSKQKVQSKHVKQANKRDKRAVASRNSA